MKKTILCVMLICQLFFYACGADPADQEVTSPDDSISDSVELETLPLPKIPEDLDFGGQEFRILSGTYNDYCFLTVEEFTGEILNDTKYQMQLNTEEKLKVTIVEEDYYVTEANTIAISLVLSGDETYAAMNQLDRFSVDLMMGGYLRTLEEAEHIDLEAEWWTPQITKKLSLGAKTYYAVSAANILMYADTSAIYVNSRLAVSSGLSMDTLYNDVRTGTWTLDKMNTYMADSAYDLDGDGKMTIADQWGLSCYDENILGPTIIAAGGVDSINKDKDDVLTLAWDNESYVNMVEIAHRLFHSDVVFTGGARHTSTVFAEGRSLFMHGFFLAVDSLEEMEDDYGIVPIPKMNENQKNYICETYDMMTFVMPKFINNTEIFGAVLEWMSYEGKAHVQDAYIETTLKYKKARDQATSEMVQICLDSSLVDLGSIYAYDQCSYDAIYVKLMMPANLNFASYSASQMKILDKRLAKIMEAVTPEE